MLITVAIPFHAPPHLQLVPRSGPHRFDESESYAGASVTASVGENVNYAHSLGEIVSAAARAGFRVDTLNEHLDAAFDPRGDLLSREDDGRYRFRLTAQPLPVL